MGFFSAIASLAGPLLGNMFGDKGEEQGRAIQNQSAALQQSIAKQEQARRARFVDPLFADMQRRLSDTVVDEDMAGEEEAGRRGATARQQIAISDQALSNTRARQGVADVSSNAAIAGGTIKNIGDTGNVIQAINAGRTSGRNDAKVNNRAEFSLASNAFQGLSSGADAAAGAGEMGGAIEDRARENTVGVGTAIGNAIGKLDVDKMISKISNIF